MPVCVKCSQFVGRRAHGVECSRCHSAHHAKCLGLSSDALAVLVRENPKWKCDTCKNTTKRKSLLIDDDIEVCAPPKDPQLESICEELKSLNKKYQDILTSINFCSDKISDFEKSLATLENKCKGIDALQNENKELKLKISNLQQQVEDQAQYSRVYNVEIQGVPYKNDENVYQILEAIGREIHCPMDEVHVEYAHRVPSRNPNNKDGNIIARFFSRRIRDKVLAVATRMKRDRRSASVGGTPARGIKVEGVGDGIFINEHLSPKNRNLFKLARDAARTASFKFVWSRNGSIYARKDERSRIVTIKSSDDVSKISRIS